ncbi:MAG: TonB-dependent receptor [Candidatus Poribacteria bacterium]|nr:TonB-dependent receptor [Candidatus Poribacteria bacterium]
MKRTLHQIALSALCAASVLTAEAQVNDESDVQELDTVTVTATRNSTSAFDAPTAVTVVMETEISRRASNGMIDALLDEPGVFTQRTTNAQGSPYIRGFTGYHTLLLIDGVRLNNSTFRSGPNQYFGTINVDEVAQVEIVRGPSSVLYGNSALGGVINVRSRVPQRMGETLEVRPRLFGRWGSSASDAIGGVGLEGGQNNLSFNASVTFKDIGDVQPGKGRDVHVKGRKFVIWDEEDAPTGFESNGKLYETTKVYDAEAPTNYTELAGNATLNVRLHDKAYLRFAYQGVQQEISSRWDKVSTGEEFDVQRFDPQDRHLGYALYEVKDIAPELERLALTLSFHRQVEGVEQLPVGGDPSADTVRIQDAINSFGATVIAESPLGASNHLTYGLDVYHDMIASEQTAPKQRAWGIYPDGSTAIDGNAFVQDEMKLNDQWTATFGANASFYQYKSDLRLADPTFGDLDKSGTAFTGSAALGYDVSDDVRLHGSAGTGFRASNLSDLTAVQVTNQGVSAPSPDLDPEHSVNLELGVKVRKARVGGGVAAFYTLLKDTLASRSVVDVYGTELPGFVTTIRNQYPNIAVEDISVSDNLDESNIRGIEADAYISPMNGVTLYGVGTVIRGEVTKIGGVEPDPTKPWEARIRRETPIHGTVGLRYEPINRDYWGEVFARAAMEQNRLDNGDIRDPRIPGFTRTAADMAFDENGNAIDAGTPGWSTLNVRVGATLFGASRVMLAVENILDKRYRWHGSGVNAPGRNVIVSLDNRF